MTALSAVTSSPYIRLVPFPPILQWALSLSPRPTESIARTGTRPLGKRSPVGEALSRWGNVASARKPARIVVIAKSLHVIRSVCAVILVLAETTAPPSPGRSPETSLRAGARGCVRVCGCVGNFLTRARARAGESIATGEVAFEDRRGTSVAIQLFFEFAIVADECAFL